MGKPRYNPGFIPVEWAPPVSNGGSDITGYRLKYRAAYANQPWIVEGNVHMDGLSEPYQIMYPFPDNKDENNTSANLPGYKPWNQWMSGICTACKTR
jgi:hypothetical protein